MISPGKGSVKLTLCSIGIVGSLAAYMLAAGALVSTLMEEDDPDVLALQPAIIVIWLIVLGVAALVTLKLTLVESRSAVTWTAASPALSQDAVRNPLDGLRVISLGRASRTRAILSSLEHALPPFTVFMAVLSVLAMPRSGSPDVDLLPLVSVAVLVPILFIATKRLLAGALALNGRGVCWVLITVSLCLIAWHLPIMFDNRVNLKTFVFVLAFLSSFGIYGALALVLHSARLNGLSNRLSLVPGAGRAGIPGRRRVLSIRILSLRARLVGYHLIWLLVAMISTFGIAGIGTAIDRRRHRLHWMMRRYETPLARDVVRLDSRPGILLLRSFHDDGLRLQDNTETDRFTFEEAITRQLWRWGPVVAIGRPAEELPETGAAREYLTNEDWQTRIVQLMSQSQFVVIIVHKTDGLRWEITQLTNSGNLGRCLFIIPPLSSAERNERWRGLWENGPHLDVDLPDGTVAVLMPHPGAETAIRGSYEELTADEYDLATELGVRLIYAARSAPDNWTT